MLRVFMVALGIMAAAAFPILCVSLAAALASAFSCTANEADVHSCLAYGIDIGPLLYILGMMGWLAIGTVPLGYVALVGLGGFWLLSHRPSHPWWPVMLLAEAALVSLWIWRDAIFRMI